MRDLDSPIGKPRGTYYKGRDCPHCHGISTSRVIDVRDTPEGRRRRHECDKCEQRFTTYEISAEQFERLQRVKVDEAQVEKAIAALTVIKTQLGVANGIIGK